MRDERDSRGGRGGYLRTYVSYVVYEKAMIVIIGVAIFFHGEDSLFTNNLLELREERSILFARLEFRFMKIVPRIKSVYIFVSLLSVVKVLRVLFLFVILSKH